MGQVTIGVTTAFICILLLGGSVILLFKSEADYTQLNHELQTIVSASPLADLAGNTSSEKIFDPKHTEDENWNIIAMMNQIRAQASVAQVFNAEQQMARG